MAVGLIGWGRFFDANGNKITVPAPTSHPGKPWLADFLRENAADLGASFDFLQWPPWSKAQGGAGTGCDGYGIFDRRDLGSKPQQGSTETRYGSLESLLAAISALNAHGCQSIGDLVLHQLIGENGGPGVFRYLGADMKTSNGRGATAAGWFRGNTGKNDQVPPFCNEDEVPSPPDDNPFGRELSYQNCSPAKVTTEDAVDYLAWLIKRTDAAGFRFDDVKGTWPSAVRTIMNQTSLPFYAEYFDSNPENLNNWATNAPMSSRSAVEDFILHWRIQAACNGFNANALNTGGAGYWEWNSGLAVGFVDNPDTDTSPGQQVIFNKGLAYAYMLTIPCRLALVYGKDYFPSSVWPGAYGLKPLIDNLCWISRMFAFGACQVRWQDQSVYVLTRDGDGGPVGWSGGLMTALNFDIWNARTIICSTPFGPNRWLHDYTGHHEDIWTDQNGNATFTIPANAFSRGESYLCFAPGGVSKPYPTTVRPTTQVFVGDRTLDVMPVVNGMQTLPQRLLCAKDTALHVTLELNRKGVNANAAVQLEVLSPDGTLLGSSTTEKLSSTTVSAMTKTDGWHTLRLAGNLLPGAGATFELSAKYTGTAR